MTIATGTQASGQTLRADSLRSPLKDFLRTETGSAVVLAVAVVVALIWANVAPGGYDETWATQMSVRVGAAGVSLDLRTWVNSGLMALFFFVVSLEARREFDMGELRERSRVALPLLAGVTAMAVPVVLYLLITNGHGAARGWGSVMSTDTAFALGTLAIVGRRLPSSVRTFLLSVAVVDDFVALAAIAVAYTGHVAPLALVVAVAGFAVTLVVRAFGVHVGAVYALLGVAVWVAVLKSGVDPVVTGLAFGLMTYAYPASRGDLERASGLFTRFREQPTPELERSVRQGLSATISPNERLQQLYHPWSSYVIVPVFALANAGIRIDAATFMRDLTSPITVGIVAAYIVGKPLGITGATWLATTISRGRLRPQVGWGSVLASGSAAGVGFTVSLLISALAFHGEQLTQAKLGILIALPVSYLVALAVTTGIRALPPSLRARAILGTGQTVIDLADPVDLDRDHFRGQRDATVTVVEYGDFECPYCSRAEPALRQLLADADDVLHVWRHLPLTDVHPHAQLAAEAAEAAAAQGAFWAMHDTLLEHQGALEIEDLRRYAQTLGLDVDGFEQVLRSRAGSPRVAEDLDSADLSGVAGTPTFFVNGRLHRGGYDLASLTKAVHVARERARLRQ